jgi:hypothetical protein
MKARSRGEVGGVESDREEKVLLREIDGEDDGELAGSLASVGGLIPLAKRYDDRQYILILADGQKTFINSIRRTHQSLATHMDPSNQTSQPKGLELYRKPSRAAIIHSRQPD